MKIEEQRRVKTRSVWMDVFKEVQSVSKPSRRCGVPRSTIYRRLQRFETKGSNRLEGISRRPHKLAKLKTDVEIKKLILNVRNKHKWDPQRIQSHFKQINGPNLSVATIWRVLKRHNAKSIKKYRRHKDFKRYHHPVPGDRVQIDVTKVACGYFPYTAIDDCTRLKYARLYPG
ncbi:MAG: helix-turn-helix domain-containing protein [Bdellovibrionaceae bacterium]|nr:helix-turn-helix domain-containing protein [Pseudobdellovibrionaceae bacterium]